MCTPTIGDLEKYRKAVKLLFEVGSKEPISNSQPDHASILIEEFFRHATQSMRILCRRLSESVYARPELIDAACDAIKRGVDVKIIIQEDKPQSTNFAKMIIENGGLLFSSTSEAVKNAQVNFAVMDQRAFRYERCHEVCEAVAYVQSDAAPQFYSVFDEVKSLGVQKLTAENFSV